ncbi:MAG: putative porin [Verrucomicrobiota bacterium]|nr:putative porin [Verrucomicrobiota bacterium]
MKNKLQKLLVVLGACVAFGVPTPVKAQQSEALVEALVRKGVLTEQEGEDIKSDLSKEFKNSGAGKFDMNKNLTKLKLYGDFRFRNEYVETRRNFTGVATQANLAEFTREDLGENAANWRQRIRLRLGADYSLTEGITTSIRLASAGAPAGTGAGDPDARSSNQTLGNFFESGTIYIDKAFATIDFVKWSGVDLWADSIVIGAGVFDNPLMGSNLMWDGDINPNGAFQAVRKTFTVDGTELTPFITVGQFMVLDNIGTAANGFLGRNAGENQDVWLFPFQLGVSTKFENKNKLDAAFTYYMWNDLSGPALINEITTGAAVEAHNRGLASNGQVTSTKYNELQPVTGYLAYEFAEFPLYKRIPAKIWAEGAYNTGVDNGQVGAQAGVMLGKLKKRGDWEIGAYYQYMEQNFWYDAFTDSDFSSGSVNRHGYVVKAGYMIADSMSFNFTWFDTDVLDQPVGLTAAAGTLPTTEVGRAQVDFNVKF